MKILVTGANGQLGQELRSLSKEYTIWTWIFLSKNEFDITDETEVKTVLNEYKPDVIINTAAYTNVEKAEEEKDMAFLVNAEGPKYLSLYADQALLLQISTDFVFNGEKNTSYSEEDLLEPINNYGYSKLAGETFIIENASRYIIIRTSWLFGTFHKNFLTKMLKLVTTKSKINVVDDQMGTPTFAGDLAKVIVKMLESENVSNGIYHFSNEGSGSWYDFAHSIFEYAKKNVQLLPVPSSEFPSPAKRPKYSVMNKSKVKKFLGIEIPHWRESLKKAVSLLEKNEI